MNELLNTLGEINWAGWLSAIATIIAIVYATASSRRERNIMLLDKRQCYLQKWRHLIDEVRESMGQVMAESDDDMFNSVSFAMSFGGRIGKTSRGEELKEELHQNFKEKDGLHLIIDRLLEASGYDTNTASAEDFEDVYENMRYEKEQLDKLKQTLAEIKEIAENVQSFVGRIDIEDDVCEQMEQILQKISECEVENAR